MVIHFFFSPQQTLFMHIPDYILLQVSQDRKASSPENKKLLGSNWWLDLDDNK